MFVPLSVRYWPYGEIPLALMTNPPPPEIAALIVRFASPLPLMVSVDANDMPLPPEPKIQGLSPERFMTAFGPVISQEAPVAFVIVPAASALERSNSLSTKEPRSLVETQGPGKPPKLKISPDAPPDGGAALPLQFDPLLQLPTPLIHEYCADAHDATSKAHRDRTIRFLPIGREVWKCFGLDKVSEL